MLEFLDHPDVRGAIAPFIVALLVGAALARTRFTWLALVAGYAAMVVFAGDFGLSPLTAARKVMLVGLLAPLVGLAADSLHLRSKYLGVALAIAAAGLAPWVFVSVLRQREGVLGPAIGAGIAIFVLLLVVATLRQRNDGLRTGATGLGLGIATGIAGVVSASIGYLLGGAALATSSGALLLIQVVLGHSMPARFTGALPIGVLAALFAAATMVLAQLPWYALPLLLLVPLAASMPVPKRAPVFARAAMLCTYTTVAALFPILAAWYGARGSLT